MKFRTIFLFNLIFLSSYSQNNSKLVQEFKLLPNSGIPGLELFICQLIIDTTGKRCIDSITIDHKRTEPSAVLYEIKENGLISFKQVFIQKKSGLNDSTMNYVIQLSYNHQSDLMFKLKKNYVKIETKLSQVNGKLNFEEKASEEVEVIIPAFSEASFSIHNYDGIIIKKLESFPPFHYPITYSDINRIEKGHDDYVIVTLSKTNIEAIGYFK